MDKTIIIERPLSSTKERKWRLAQILNFDRATNSHGVVHAKSWTKGVDCSCISVTRDNPDYLGTGLAFEENPTDVILAAREYYILERTGIGKRPTEMLSSVVSDVVMSESDPELDSTLSQLVGTRLESNCDQNADSKMYTVVAAKRDTESQEGETYFTLISDEGELHFNVRTDQLRIIGNESDSYSMRRRERDFFTTRSRINSSRITDENASNLLRDRALKRTWSAIALTESMRPTELTTSKKHQERSSFEVGCDVVWEIQLGSTICLLSVSSDIVENPPRIRVLCATKEHLPGVWLDDSETVVKMLADVQNHQDKFYDWPPQSSVQLYFSLHIDYHDTNRVDAIETDTTSDALAGSFFPHDLEPLTLEWNPQIESRSRKLSTRSIGSSDEIPSVSLCDGVDELCMQCMDVIGLFAECSEDNSSPIEKDDSCMTGMSNINMSKKLMDQLDDPLCVVGGLLPKWCIAGPSFCPRVFSYESRRTLLQRTAFGVSRSTLMQQEAKVNVGRLRQRMASLRARAVELVGEAFSGGAEDPTALQLQADGKLYRYECFNSKVCCLITIIAIFHEN
jgi:hypothetical protein